MEVGGGVVPEAIGLALLVSDIIGSRTLIIGALSLLTV